MKLYYHPGTCALAAHIALQESGAPYVIEKVNLKTKQTESGDDYFGINPKGYVPALQTDEGTLLTENVAVLQYIADLRPEARLAPPKDSFERYRLLEWLAFINSEVHATYKPFFMPNAVDEERQHAAEKLSKRLGHVEHSLESKDFLLGENFSVADAYLYTVLGWLPKTGLSLSTWPRIERFHRRIGERITVQQAQKAEEVR